MHPTITDAVARLHQKEMRDRAEHRRLDRAVRAARVEPRPRPRSLRRPAVRAGSVPRGRHLPMTSSRTA